MQEYVVQVEQKADGPAYYLVPYSNGATAMCGNYIETATEAAWPVIRAAARDCNDPNPVVVTASTVPEDPGSYGAVYVREIQLVPESLNAAEMREREAENQSDQKWSETW